MTTASVSATGTVDNEVGPFVHTAVQTEDFDLGEIYTALVTNATNPGAVVLFTGLVRELVDSPARHEVQPPQRTVPAAQTLTLEHYPGMTERALQDIADQAVRRWPLQAVRIIHRIGTLQPRDQIVVVGVASAHRQASFEAAEFIMDYLKIGAPFWKKQHVGDEQFWVESRDSDQQAAARWKNTDSGA